MSTQRDPAGHRVVTQFAPLADPPPKHSPPRGLSTQLLPGLQTTVRQLEAPKHCTPLVVGTHRLPGGQRVVKQLGPAAELPPSTHSLPRGLLIQLEPGEQTTVRQVFTPKRNRLRKI